MKIPKNFLPDHVSEDDVDSIKNKDILYNLLFNGWNYDIETNLYEFKQEDTWIFAGISLMSDDNLWGRVYVGGMSNMIGSKENKFDRFNSWTDLCERIDGKWKNAITKTISNQL